MNSAFLSLPRQDMGVKTKTMNRQISRECRGKVLGQREGFRGCTIWFTGLSGAGKTTLSFAVEEYLCQQGIPSYALDGDNIGHLLQKDAVTSDATRVENIRRVAELSRLFADCGVVCLTSFISPFIKDRAMAREIHRQAGLQFLEIFVKSPRFICESRDVRGLYKKALVSEIKDFTGIDQLYEDPENPELTVRTDQETVKESVIKIIALLREKKIIPESLTEIVYELFVPKERIVEVTREADLLPQLDLTTLDVQWLQVLSEGWATPLRGFMREKEYLQCQYFSCLLKDEIINQSIAIVLPVSTEDKRRLELERAFTLRYKGKPLAVMRDPEFYPHLKEERCARQFGTINPVHPYIRMIMNSGEWLCGGDLEVLDKIRWNDGLDEYRKTPKQLRAEFVRLGADAVYAFHLRNPINNGHTMLMQEARSILNARGYKRPILLLHPIGGWVDDDDVPISVRIAQHNRVLADDVLEPELTVLAIFPSPMMYAGPAEAQWHAKARMIGGANFYVVKRETSPCTPLDSRKDLYEPQHAASVLTMAPGLRGLEILVLKNIAYDKKHRRMTVFDESRREDLEFITGSRVRALARGGQEIPQGLMSLSAWKIVVNHYRGNAPPPTS